MTRLVFFLMLSLAVVGASCGSDSEPAVEDPQDLDDEFADPEDAGEWERVESRDDLIQLESATPTEVVTPDDDPVIFVRYEGAAEPCAGAMVRVTESPLSVTIEFFTGLDPNVAAMSCIARVFPYEIAAVLNEPAGRRTIVIADS